MTLLRGKWGRDLASNPSGVRLPFIACCPTHAIICRESVGVGELLGIGRINTSVLCLLKLSRIKLYYAFFLSNTYFNSDTPTAIYYTSVTANYRRPNVQLYIHASDG